jgi:hypothetical protein
MIAKISQHDIDDIRRDLKRLAASEVRVSLDPDFEPKVGPLLKVDYDGSYWHMIPQDFRNLLAELPDGCGAAEIKYAIEAKVTHLWHGPSSKGSRDTSG